MAPETSQHDASGSESSRMTGTPSNTPPAETQLQCRPQLVHRHTSNAATGNMTLDTQSQLISQTGSRNNNMHHARRCEYSRIKVNGHQLMIWHAPAVHRELRDQSISACNEKNPWSITECVRAVSNIDHRDVVSSGIAADHLSDSHPREWTIMASTIWESAMEASTVEVIAESAM